MELLRQRPNLAPGDRGGGQEQGKSKEGYIPVVFGYGEGVRSRVKHITQNAGHKTDGATARAALKLFEAAIEGHAVVIETKKGNRVHRKGTIVEKHQ